MDNKLITTPFSETVAHVSVLPGQTISDILLSAHVPFLIWDQVVVTLNGIELARDQWDILLVREDDILTVFVTQHGGNTGKTILRLVAIIAVAAFAAYVGGAAVSAGLVAEGGVGVAAITAGITLVGVLAINALIPPPTQDLSQSGSALGNSYFLSGQENRARFYELIPIVYGTHKMIANLASSVDVFTAGESSIFTAVYDFGLGGVTLSQLQVGDTAIEILNGQSRILKRVPEVLNGPVDLTLIKYPISYQALSLGLDGAGDTRISTTADGCVAAVVELAFPSGIVHLDKKGKESYSSVSLDLSWRPIGDTTWLNPSQETRAYGGAHLQVQLGNPYNPGIFPRAVGSNPGNISTVDAYITTTTAFAVNDGVAFKVRVEFRGPAYAIPAGTAAFTLYNPETDAISTAATISGGITTITPGRTYEFTVVHTAGYKGRAYLKMDSSDFKSRADAPPYDTGVITSPIWRIDMTITSPPATGNPLPLPPAPSSGLPRYSVVAGSETYIEQVERRKYPYTGTYVSHGAAMNAMVDGSPYAVAHASADVYRGELLWVGSTWKEGDWQYRVARYAVKYQPIAPQNVLRVGDPVQPYLPPDYQPRGNTGAITITGNKAHTGIVSIVIPFPTPGKFDIRIVRNTPEPTDPQTVNACTWVKLNTRGSSIGADAKSILNLKKQHTLMELQFEAGENISGNVQQLSAIARGEIRPYNGGWQAPIITSNPAWVVLDVLTGYSVQNHQDFPTSYTFDGGWIKDEQIDFTTFERLAALCDEQVTYTDVNAQTLTRPRYACNILMATDSPIMETVQSILSMARCQLIMNQEGKYSVLFDEVKTTPRQLFTPQNSWGFSGYRAYQDIPHALHVEFTAPELGYQTGTQTVYRPGYDVNNSTVYETLQTYGITNWHQASWYSLYMLAQGFLRSEQFTLFCDLENLVVQRGDMVHIQHDVPLFGGTACIVSQDSSTTRVFVDQQLGSFPQPWGFTLRKMDGTILTGNVTAIGPDYFDMASATITTQGEVVVIGQKKATADDKVTDPYLIIAINPTRNLQAELALVRYDDALYGTDWGDFPVWNPSFGASPSDTTELYTFNLKGYAGLSFVDKQPVSTSNLTWDILPVAILDTCAFIQVTYSSTAGGESTLLAQLDGNARSWVHEYSANSIQDYGHGFYTVTPLSNLGYLGLGQTIQMGQLLDDIPPAQPANLTARFTDTTGLTTLTWDANTEPDMAGYMIYWAATNVGHTAAALLGFTEPSVTQFLVVAPTEMFYYVTAMDTSNNESTAATIKSTNIPTGASGVSGYLTNEVHSVTADKDGFNYDLTNAGGTFMMFEGTTDVTGLGPDYDIVGGVTAGGFATLKISKLTMSINVITGAYSLSGTEWNAFQTGFTLSATYFGVTIEKFYGITKSVAGADGSPAETIRVFSTAQMFQYNAAGAVVGANQIVFTAEPVGNTGPVYWVGQVWNGTAWVQTLIDRLSPTSGLTTTLTEAQFAAEGAPAIKVVGHFTSPEYRQDPITIQRVQDGQAGINGYNSAVVYLYQRTASATPPTLPSALTYTFATGLLSPNPSPWSQTVPSGTAQYLWVTTASAVSQATSVVLNTVNWATPVIQGQDGIQARTIELYQRKTTNTPVPAVPSVNVTYTFATGVITGQNNGWLTSIPATGGDYVFVTQAQALATAQIATDTILPAEWTTAVVMSQNGTNGLSVAELAIYARSPTALTIAPTGGSYSFDTQILTPPAGWTSAVPSGADPVYTCRGVASIVGVSGTDNTITWSAPVLVLMEGQSIDIVFRRSATQPATPPPSAGVPTSPVVWYTDVNSVPVGTDLLWSTVGTRLNTGALWVWDLPIQVEGQAGAIGLSVAELSIFVRSETTPVTPTGGSFNFSTQILTPPASWTSSIPVGGSPLWESRGTASISGNTGTDSVIPWATPVKVTSDGSAVDIVYNRWPVGFNTAPPPSASSPPVNWYGDASQVPAGANPMFSCVGTRVNSSQNWIWDTPVQLEGSQGYNSATVQLWQRTTTTAVPTSPPTSTYTFSSGTFSPSISPWSQTIPAAGSNYLWTTTAVALAQASSDQILQTEWATPIIAGAEGTQTQTIDIYRKTASNVAPALPSATATYTWATGVLTGLNNTWTTYVPASGGGYLWTSQATALATIASTVDTIGPGEWVAPTLIAIDGVSTNATPNSMVISVWVDGAVYYHDPATGVIEDASGNNLNGKYAVRLGTTNVTEQCTFDVISCSAGGVHGIDGSSTRPNSADHNIWYVNPSDNISAPNGFRFYVWKNAGSGNAGTFFLYVSPADAWTTDTIQFTLRATYNGVNYDSLIQVTKATAGQRNVSMKGNSSIVSNTASGTEAKAGFRIDSDGNHYKLIQGVATSLGPWLWDSTSKGLYSVMASIAGQTSNNLTGSLTNTWLTCDLDRTWTCTDPVTADAVRQYCTLVVDIKENASGQILDSRSFVLDAFEA